MVCRIPLVTKSYHCPTSSQQLLLSSLQNPGLLLLLSFPPNPGLFLSTAQSCNQLTLLGLLLQLRLGKIPHFLILRFLNFFNLKARYRSGCCCSGKAQEEADQAHSRARGRFLYFSFVGFQFIFSSAVPACMPNSQR